jgi:uncharacterized protein (DUF488 family)
MDAPVIFTVGHSTHPFGEFVEMLKGHAITRLIDVRTVPRSRHNPQFGQDQLAPALAAEGIAYEHAPGLGGFRRPREESPNGGWRNTSFRGYADYMQTPEFADELEKLIGKAGRERVAIMCAEAVPWRCHRSLISDALLVHGLRVEDIAGRAQARAHRLTPFAVVRGTELTYPAQ